jgi:hypothetical protein
MLFDRNQLESMKMPELKALAVEMGLTPSLPSETKDVLISRLMVEVAKEPETKHVEEKEPMVQQPTQCTIEEVRKAVGEFIMRGMKMYYSGDDKTWLFRVQLKSMAVRDSLTGETRMVERWRDDSGTLNQPLDTIVRCARVLMQNSPTPREIEPEKNVTAGYEAVA